MAVRQNPGAPDRCERQVAGEESPNHGQRSQTQLSVWPMSRLLGGMAYNLQMPACSAEATASPWRYAGDRANRRHPPALPLLCPIRLADVMSIAAAFCPYLPAYDLRDHRLRSPPVSSALSVKRGLHFKP